MNSSIFCNIIIALQEDYELHRSIHNIPALPLPNIPNKLEFLDLVTLYEDQKQMNSIISA